MDFEELREYIPGDDVRDIDWNVSHRMGRPFVKRYREERELAMVLAVDCSASSGFGSLRRTKREFATEIAATLALSAARSGDKVGLLLFTEAAEFYLPPRKGRRHILRVLREMLTFEPRHRGTNIAEALSFVNRVIRRRSIVFLMTDFLHSGNHQGPLIPAAEGGRRGGEGRDVIQEMGLTNARHDLVCLHLLDPRESALPDAGLLTVEDAETGELLEVDSGRAGVRERFAQVNAARLADLDRALNRAGVETLRFTTATDFAPMLQRFFEIRRGRRRG